MKSEPKAAATNRSTLKQRLWEIVFEAETPAGKAFDVALLWAISLSVLAVMLETVAPIRARFGRELLIMEWFFTILFTFEYLLRLWLSRKPLRYATSAFGVIDLLSCLPTYIGIAYGSGHGFAVVRVLRLLRMFRVLKMVHHLRGARIILRGLRQARPKITVFFAAVLLLCTVAGALLYLIEGREPGTEFTSIPISIYYAIVSVTTVGYGDIYVTTDLGRFITAIMILTGTPSSPCRRESSQPTCRGPRQRKTTAPQPVQDAGPMGTCPMPTIAGSVVRLYATETGSLRLPPAKNRSRRRSFTL